MLAVTLTGCSRTADTPGLAAPDGRETRRLRWPPAPSAHTGDNTLGVTLGRCYDGGPVGNANITATPEMLSPRLPGSSTTGRAQGNGFYTIPVRLGVASKYSITLKIERPGKAAAEAAFPVEAAQ